MLDEWLLDVKIARYAHQDIAKLRGLDRPLTMFEKRIVEACLEKMIALEVQPLQML